MNRRTHLSCSGTISFLGFANGPWVRAAIALDAIEVEDDEEEDDEENAKVKRTKFDSQASIGSISRSPSPVADDSQAVEEVVVEVKIDVSQGESFHTLIISRFGNASD